MTSIFLLLIPGLSGCFRYSFSGAVPSHIKTVALPLFENKTAEYGISEEITDKLTLAFQKDNTLKISSEQDADAILRGVLVKIDDVPYTYSGTGTGQNFDIGEYKLSLTVSLEYYDQMKNEVIWKKDLSSWGTYNHQTGSPDERTQGFEQAIDKLTQDIVNLTISGW
ncbi:MAG: LptE family protein [bacterium]|nr:LptE family protein [bacterium]